MVLETPEKEEYQCGESYFIQLCRVDRNHHAVLLDGSNGDARIGPTTGVVARVEGATMGDHRTEGRLQRRKTWSPFTTAEERAKKRVSVLRWQHQQKAAGRCRCGAAIAAGSLCRCWECLERSRRVQSVDRGNPVKGRRKRGRPMLGDLSERRRRFEREEERRRRVEERMGWRAPRYRWLS